MKQSRDSSFDRHLKQYAKSAESSPAKKSVKDLMAYAAAAGTLTALPGAAMAAVVYTAPPNPHTIDPSPYSYTSSFIDVNQDFLADLAFYAATSTTTVGASAVVGGSAHRNVEVLVKGGFPMPVARGLDSGYVISANRTIWNSYGYLNWFFNPATGVTFSYGDFFQQGDKYLGIRFDDQTGTHYGWVRVNVATHHSVRVMDWAYEACPNVPIMAGRTNSLCGDQAAVPSLNDWGKTVFILILAALALKMMKKKEAAA